MSRVNNEEQSAGTLKGLRIQTLSLWMVICTLLVALLIGNGIINVMKQYQELSDMTQKYIRAQKDVMNMSVGSDYLTDQVRLYVITGESRYADAYFKEAEVTKRRDIALEGIEGNLRKNDKETLRLSNEALELSNELMKQEIHAMKLTALSAEEDINGLPPKVQEYPLTEEELGLTPEDKLKAAQLLVFGPEYKDAKQKIEDKLSGVTESVIKICETEQAESQKAMKNALTWQSICIILVVLLVIFSYAMIAVLILRPIKIYINCIKNNNFLEITGAYEFKYFAATYNNVYEMSLEQQDILRQKAERDALTGLLNRQAFEQVKTHLHNVPKSIALLLIDVDVFKSINDNYGHDVGDQALIKVARLLEESFRSADYVFRIGGDEFAVIMEKIKPDGKNIIIEKINQINRILKNPPKDFPEYSVSVGAAFSENGYHDELFRQTDSALYHTKENGRCGYTFYTPEE